MRLTRTAAGCFLLAILPSTPSAVPESGDRPYHRVCSECHDKGKSKTPAGRGAPRLGDARAWESRVAKGADALAAKILKTEHGRDLPADQQAAWRGTLTDAEVRSALDFMLDQLP